MLGANESSEDLLRLSITRSIDARTPQVDLWPRIESKMRNRGRRGHVGGLALAALVVAAVGLSSAVAMAGPEVARVIVTTLNPATVGIADAPTPAVTSTVAEAAMRAGIKPLQPSESVAKFVGAQIVPAPKEIQGRPVADQVPYMRLTYRIASGTVTLIESGNLHPEAPMVVAQYGGTTRIERDASTERVYGYDGSNVRVVAWATPELWVGVEFNPPVAEDEAKRFVSGLR